MNLQSLQTNRKKLLQLYAAALKAVDARRVMMQHLQTRPLSDQSYWLIAIGKAAPTMAQGAWEVGHQQIARGLIITKEGHAALWPQLPSNFECIEAGHPVPDARSLSAGEKLLAFIAAIPADAAVLFLLSGGASALAEVLPEYLTLADLQQFNKAWLASGLAIDQINAQRKQVSLIKGGKLAPYLYPHPVRQCVISDVPGDRLADIGSGLLIADAATANTDAKYFAAIDTCIVASNSLAREAVIKMAQQANIPLRCNAAMSGDAVAAGRAIARELRSGRPGLYLYGGETVVTLPDAPGRGGRCQSLALAAATELDGWQGGAMLAASTDGSDGPAMIAGAIIDGETCVRGRLAGMDPVAALANADAGSFLEQSGDLIDTGPTGTNVMDLVMAIIGTIEA